MTNQEEILTKLIPFLAHKYLPINELTNQDIQDFIGELQLDFLLKDNEGKFDGKESGYVSATIVNKIRDLLKTKGDLLSRVKIREEHVRYDEEGNESTIFDNSTIGGMDDLILLKDNPEVIEFEKWENEINLIPDFLPFSEWNHASGGYLPEPIFPSNYSNKIENFERRIYPKPPYNAKRLFFKYLDGVSIQDHKEWDRVNFFTYYGAMKEFCKVWKYSGWKNLQAYSSEYRKLTGRLGEYYYMEQLIEAINHRNNEVIDWYDKTTPIHNKATLANICEYFNLRYTHHKVLYYLGYLVISKKVIYKYDDNLSRGTYRI